MGIVAKSRLQSMLGLGGRVRAEVGLFAWAEDAVVTDTMEAVGQSV
jgi:hypothetical protein